MALNSKRAKRKKSGKKKRGNELNLNGSIGRLGVRVMMTVETVGRLPTMTITLVAPQFHMPVHLGHQFDLAPGLQTANVTTMCCHEGPTVVVVLNITVAVVAAPSGTAVCLRESVCGPGRTSLMRISMVEDQDIRLLLMLLTERGIAVGAHRTIGGQGRDPNVSALVRRPIVMNPHNMIRIRQRTIALPA